MIARQEQLDDNINWKSILLDELEFFDKGGVCGLKTLITFLRAEMANNERRTRPLLLTINDFVRLNAHDEIGKCILRTVRWSAENDTDNTMTFLLKLLRTLKKVTNITSFRAMPDDGRPLSSEESLFLVIKTQISLSTENEESLHNNY